MKERRIESPEGLRCGDEAPALRLINSSFLPDSYQTTAMVSLTRRGPRKSYDGAPQKPLLGGPVWQNRSVPTDSPFRFSSASASCFFPSRFHLQHHQTATRQGEISQVVVERTSSDEVSQQKKGAGPIVRRRFLARKRDRLKCGVRGKTRRHTEGPRSLRPSTCPHRRQFQSPPPLVLASLRWAFPPRDPPAGLQGSASFCLSSMVSIPYQAWR